MLLASTLTLMPRKMVYSGLNSVITQQHLILPSSAWTLAKKKECKKFRLIPNGLEILLDHRGTISKILISQSTSRGLEKATLSFRWAKEMEDHPNLRCLVSWLFTKSIDKEVWLLHGLRINLARLNSRTKLSNLSKLTCPLI